MCERRLFYAHPPLSSGQRKVWLSNPPFSKHTNTSNHIPPTRLLIIEDGQGGGAGAKNKKNRTYISFLPLLPQFFVGKDGYKKAVKLLFSRINGQTRLLYLNTVIGLGQGEQLLLCDSHVKRLQILGTSS